MNRRLRSERVDAPTFVMHWMIAAALVLSAATGFRMASDNLDAHWSRWLQPALPQGDVVYWHVGSAVVLILITVAYVVFLLRAELGARVRPSLLTLVSGDRAMRARALNRVLYWLGFACLAVLLATGLLLLYAPALLPPAALRSVHEGAAWALVAYVALHVAGQVALGGLRQLAKIFVPRLLYGTAAAAATLGASVVFFAILVPAEQAVSTDLPIERVSELPTIDGDPGDSVWQRARPVTIQTTDGSHLVNGHAEVRVRAVHDGTRAAMLFEWRDPTRSQKHLPLLKTEHGWIVLQHRYGIQDEDTYYEDKVAVIHSRRAHLGSGGTAHWGPNPLPEKPGAANARGLHYTTDGSYVDLWHWKSVRNGPLRQLDDNHFGPPLAATDKPGARYTGGYTQDPNKGGGFDQNWVKSEGSPYVTPKRLPRDLTAVQHRLGRIDLDPGAHDEGEWWMTLEETVPYTPELDSYPVGTILPSVLIDKPFEGDRGDVAASGTWRDGWWRLEVSRQLETHSKYDIPIAHGIYMWVSVFDHTQTRHTRHLRPIRLTLE
jgi:Ethylbenzene dehydrogenase/Prokaryotic cytochrome b561